MASRRSAFMHVLRSPHLHQRFPKLCLLLSSFRRLQQCGNMSRNAAQLALRSSYHLSTAVRASNTSASRFLLPGISSSHASISSLLRAEHTLRPVAGRLISTYRNVAAEDTQAWRSGPAAAAAQIGLREDHNHTNITIDTATYCSRYPNTKMAITNKVLQRPQDAGRAEASTRAWQANYKLRGVKTGARACS